MEGLGPQEPVTGGDLLPLKLGLGMVRCGPRQHLLKGQRAQLPQPRLRTGTLSPVGARVPRRSAYLPGSVTVSGQSGLSPAAPWLTQVCVSS